MTTVYGTVLECLEEEDKNVKYRIESRDGEIWVVDIEPQLIINEGDKIKLHVDREKLVFVSNGEFYIITSEDVFELNGEKVWDD